MIRKPARSLITLSSSALVLVALAFAGDPLLPAGPLSPHADSVASAANDPAGPAPREQKIARRGLALPYFSFARGVRRIGG